MIKDVVTDRTKIPDILETQLITVDSTALQKEAKLVAGTVGVLAAAAFTALGFNAGDVQGVQRAYTLLAVTIVVAVALLSWAIVAAADINSRGRVTAANFQLRAQPPSMNVTSPPGAPGTSAGLWVHVKGEDGDDLELVVDSRTHDGETQLLLGKGTATPKWHKLDELDRFETRVGALASGNGNGSHPA
ncbi:MAG: hypothetical protein ACXV9P_13435 [Acidimicrobiia bacterium]